MKRLLAFVMRLYPEKWRARYGVEFRYLLDDAHAGWGDLWDVFQGGLKMRLETGDFMHLSRRDKTAIVVAAVGIVTLVGLWGKFTVPEYEASTVILIDSGRIDEYKVVLPDVEARIGMINEQLMSARRLQRIIDTYDLYKPLRGKKTQQEIIEQMRRDIQVEVLPNKIGKDDSMHGFRIRYRGSQAPLVAQVTNQLASLFIEENLKVREGFVKHDLDFLDARLKELRDRIAKAETVAHNAKAPVDRELDARDVSLLRDYYSKTFVEKLDLENGIERRKSERFTILDPARIPEKPIGTRFAMAGW